ncbi:hypothetical protein WP50_22715 [Lactiplantibacillus plantarum]|nr:hypothetical protein WP50_22715 [Lactiplantibacillus plantarum]
MAKSKIRVRLIAESRIMRMEIISTTIIIVIIEIIIAIIGTRLSDSTVATHLMGATVFLFNDD